MEHDMDTPQDQTTPQDETDARDASRYWVRSVDRATSVLDLLGAQQSGEGLSVTEISGSLGLSKSAVFATLYTLQEKGYVASRGAGQGRTYRLGPRVLHLGARAAAQTSIRDVARPHLQALSREIGATARLALFHDDAIVVIDQVGAEASVSADLGMGARELLHSTGLGKAVLSRMPERDVRAVAARVGLPARTSRTITDVDTLVETLADARAVGYAVDDEEDADGVFCIGAPLVGANGKVAGAMSITNLKLGQPTWAWQRYGARIAEAARIVSAELGHADMPNAT